MCNVSLCSAWSRTRGAFVVGSLPTPAHRAPRRVCARAGVVTGRTITQRDGTAEQCTLRYVWLWARLIKHSNLPVLSVVCTQWKRSGHDVIWYRAPPPDLVLQIWVLITKAFSLTGFRSNKASSPFGCLRPFCIFVDRFWTTNIWNKGTLY